MHARECARGGNAPRVAEYPPSARRQSWVELMADHAATHSYAESIPWWVQPAATVTILSAFVVYVFWAALQGRGYFAPYLSPFYSPQIWIIWAPGGFRATCYYYRKAYYRSYFGDPISCLIPEGRRRYTGETAFPFVLNNLHRY